MESFAEDSQGFTLFFCRTYIVMINGKILCSVDDQTSDPVKLVEERTLTVLGIKSKCKALILYKIPFYEEFDENEDDEIELRIECIESQRFYLHKRAENLWKNGKWVQFVDGDESSDFLMKQKSHIDVEIKGALKTSDGHQGKKKIKFLKDSSCFIEMPLTVTKKNIGEKGWVYCYLGGVVVHWRSITWDQILQRYRGK
jgi:hypothetical protein